MAQSSFLNVQLDVQILRYECIYCTLSNTYTSGSRPGASSLCRSSAGSVLPRYQRLSRLPPRVLVSLLGETQFSGDFFRFGSGIAFHYDLGGGCFRLSATLLTDRINRLALCSMDSCREHVRSRQRPQCTSTVLFMFITLAQSRSSLPT